MAIQKGTQPLSSADLLKLWETAYGSSRIVRAQKILYNALPKEEQDVVKWWCIGEGDAFLFRLYRSMFGIRLECMASCPACSAKLEMTLKVEDLLTKHGSGKSTYQITFGKPSKIIFFRLPNREDFLALPEAEPHETLKKLLVERCVLYVEHKGKNVSPLSLSDQAIDAVSQAMSREDPQAEPVLNITCPECQHAWQTTFDIVDFLWQKINTEAKRLMAEIHTLAQAYGWTESEIMSLPEERRKLYIKLIS
jgi:hypothetical protein